jgi:hypothetical protein
MPFYFKTGPYLFVLLFCHLGLWRLFIMHRVSVVSDGRYCRKHVNMHMHLGDANNAGNTASQTAEHGGFLYAVNANAKRIKPSH